MSKDKLNTMSQDTNNTTALATTNDEVLAQAAYTSDGFNLASLEPSQQLEIIREIQEAEATLEAMALPMVNSKDILGVEINIVDASFKKIVEKKTGEESDCVNFVCQNVQTGELFTVLKGSNAFNDAYANRFQKLRGIAVKPLMGYEFVEDSRWSVAGNNSIVLRRKSTAKVATGKK